MAIQECPNCKLINPENAIRCDCGYNFKTRSVIHPAGQTESKNTSDKIHANKNFEPVTMYSNYSEVPFHRKRWFMVVSILLFIPLTLIIALSGDIFLLKDGKIYRYDEKGKKSIITFCVVFLVLGLLRLMINMSRSF